MVESNLLLLQDSKALLKEENARWIADPQNQVRLLEMLETQIQHGHLEETDEMLLMRKDLAAALLDWNQTYRPRVQVMQRYECFACSKAFDSDEEDSEDLEERIEALREEESLHKDAALELVLQATGEAFGAGGCAASGFEIPAIYEGIQSTRHFIQGCKEYNEGVRCGEEADALESCDIEDETSSWWPFWK